MNGIQWCDNAPKSELKMIKNESHGIDIYIFA